jgi:hypothetical protein
VATTFNVMFTTCSGFSTVLSVPIGMSSLRAKPVKRLTVRFGFEAPR